MRYWLGGLYLEELIFGILQCFKIDQVSTNCKTCHKRYSSSGLMCAMDFIYCLSHDCPLDIDSDDFVSIGLLSRTITVVVGDWCFTNYAHGWWVSI